jgi:ssDNA-binding Zn-finger/Zn-ribbon topoisomerase 1
LNNDCPSKSSEDKKVIKHITALENGTIVHKCPKCDKDLVLRRSVWGQFLGCTGFPACRYTEKIPQDDAEKAKVEKRREYFRLNKTSDRYDHRYMNKKKSEIEDSGKKVNEVKKENPNIKTEQNIKRDKKTKKTETIKSSKKKN